MARSHTLQLLLTTLTLYYHLTSQQEQDTAITRFQQYLRINTAHPNPNYTAALNFILTQAQTLAPALTTQTLYFAPRKPLILIKWQGSIPSLPSVLFNSHIDSVPAEPSKWTHPPFAAYKDDHGRIFARGAQDDKCIGMQYIEAIRRLLASGFRPKRSVVVCLVPEEEVGGFDGWGKFVESKEFEELNVGLGLDEGQANPGDEFRVFYADRSPWGLVIKANGMPGHGSRMFDNSAVENLMKSVDVISKFREGQFEYVKAGVKMNSEVVSVNPVYINAGTPTPTGYQMNMQPSEVEAGFDVRIPPTEDPDLIKRRIAEEWAPAIRNMTYQIIEKGPVRDNMGCSLMTLTNDSNPWWPVFKQAIEATGEKLAKPEILASTTDARHLRQLGIPVFGFSPMKNTPILLHDHNEFLKDTTYLKGIEVYESLIRLLSSFEGVHLLRSVN